MTKGALFIAFHFPPYGGSSGSRRTVGFVRHLPACGWMPVVLTAHIRAYDQIKLVELRDIPETVRVERAFAFDAARLSVLGRYPSCLAVPDRWMSWQPFARRVGARLIRDHKLEVIWSTYPIASAHAIAGELQRQTNLPWVADMRDPMVEKDPYTGVEYPRDPAVRHGRLEVEALVASRAAHVVFCTESAREIFVRRYGERLRERTSVISNGYEEEVFIDAERTMVPMPRREEFRVVHSGTVYPGEDRGPNKLFEAIAKLAQRGALPPGFRLVLRATGYDAHLSELIYATGVQKFVELAPPIPYREALQEMLSADALLLLQGRASNPAVPAKLYEYLRAKRPILALVHHEGETARLLKTLNAATMAPLDDETAIMEALTSFFPACAANTAPIATPQAVASFSRSAQAKELGALLSRVTASCANASAS